MITYRLSDLEEKEGLRILEKYLIKDKVFARLQKDARRCDLNYILRHIIDDMHISKNNTMRPDNPISRNKDKYVFASSIPKDILENPKFLDRLENKNKFTSIKIERYKIEKYIDVLIDSEQAYLLHAINPTVKLRKQKRILRQFEYEIYFQLSEQTLKNRTKKALKSLYNVIIQAENNLIKLEGF